MSGWQGIKLLEDIQSWYGATAVGTQDWEESLAGYLLDKGWRWQREPERDVRELAAQVRAAAADPARDAVQYTDGSSKNVFIDNYTLDAEGRRVPVGPQSRETRIFAVRLHTRDPGALGLKWRSICAPEPQAGKFRLDPEGKAWSIPNGTWLTWQAQVPGYLETLTHVSIWDGDNLKAVRPLAYNRAWGWAKGADKDWIKESQGDSFTLSNVEFPA